MVGLCGGCCVGGGGIGASGIVCRGGRHRACLIVYLQYVVELCGGRVVQGLGCSRWGCGGVGGLCVGEGVLIGDYKLKIVH